MLKKILFPLVAMFMLAGCATPPTTIEVSPKITLPQQDPSLMGVTVNSGITFVSRERLSPDAAAFFTFPAQICPQKR